MRSFLILLSSTIVVLAQTPTPQQTIPTESQILGGIISQQSQENARLTVELLRLQDALKRSQAEIEKEKSRANAAESGK